MVEIQIGNGNKVYTPIISDSVTWETERLGSPGKITFTVIKDDVISFQEGNPIILKVDNKNVFYGFVFKKTRDKEHNIKVTAYDQLRYLKNKDTLKYKGWTASELLKFIIEDKFNTNKKDNSKNTLLAMGEIEDTGYVIAERDESNTTYFDMILNALDLTLVNKGIMYVLYDDFGKLTLKSLSSMKTMVLINEETGENFDYTTNIDDKTYNQIKIQYENEKTGKIETYIAKDSSHINDWGLLQYYDTVKNVENAQAKADGLLNLYNAKTRNLKIKNAFGNLDVRAGKMVVVVLRLGDIDVGNYFLVESCKHTINNEEHFMDLTLKGGGFIE